MDEADWQAVTPLYNWMGGRSTFFALIAIVVGSVLAFLGKLTPSYAALIGAIQAFVVVRAVSEDRLGDGK